MSYSDMGSGAPTSSIRSLPADIPTDAAPRQAAQDDPGFMTHDGPPPEAPLQRKHGLGKILYPAYAMKKLGEFVDVMRSLPSRLKSGGQTQRDQPATNNKVRPGIGDPTETVHVTQNSYQPVEPTPAAAPDPMSQSERDDFASAGFLIVEGDDVPANLPQRQGPRFSDFYSTASEDGFYEEDEVADLTKQLFADETETAPPKNRPQSDKIEEATGPRNGGKLPFTSNLLVQHPVAGEDTTDPPAAGSQERIQVRSPLLAQDPPATQDTDATAAAADGNAENSRFSMELKRVWDL